MEEINVYNLHEYSNYRLLPHLNQIIISWDKNNKQLDSLMLNENLLISENSFKNSLWVNELKKATHWEPGKCVGLFVNDNISQTRIIIYVIDTSISQHYVMIKLDEDGYLMVKKNNVNTREQIFERVNCLYNDLLSEEYSPYMLK
jgi:hypothetical protein